MSTALKLLQRTPDQPADLLQGNPELGKVNTAAGYTPGDVPVVGTSGGASGDALSFVSSGVGIEVVLEDGVKCYHHPAVAGVTTLLQFQMVTQSRAVALHRWVKRAGNPSATIEWLRSAEYGGGAGGGPGISMDKLGRALAGQAPTTVAGTTPLGSWFREELVLFNIAGSQAPGAYLSYACYDVAGDLVFPIIEQWNSTQIARAYRYVTFGKSNNSPTFPEFWQTDLRATVNRTVHITGAPLTIEGAGALTLPQLEAAGTADVGSTGTSGPGDLVLPQLQLAGAGTVKAGGVGALTLPQLEAAGAAIVRTTGAAAFTLPQLQVVGLAGVADLATGALPLPQLAVAAAATVRALGPGALPLPQLQVSAAGTVTSSAAAALVLGQLQAAGSAIVRTTGAGAAVLPQLQAAGAGIVRAGGVGALVLPQLVVAGYEAGQSVGQLVLPKLQVAGAALVRTTGAGTLQLGQLTAAGQALVRDLAAGAVQLPQLTVVATALVSVRGHGVLELPMLVVAGSTLPGEYPAVVVVAVGRPRDRAAVGRSRSLPATGRGGGYAAGGGGLRAIGRPKL